MDAEDTSNPSTLPRIISNEGGDDPKRLTHLSTILVATLQEMKDRVGQIEFLFCSHIFPGFQSRNLDAAVWRKRESDLMQELEESRSLEAALEREKDEIWGEKAAVKAKVGVLEKKNVEILSELEGLKVKVEVLEREKVEILRRCDCEKKALVAEIEGSRTDEVKVVVQLRERIGVLEGENRDMEERLAKEIAMKDEELMVEKGKRKFLFDDSKALSEKFKQVKSQYRFLLKKGGLLTAKDRSDVVSGGSPVTPHNLNTDENELKDFENEDDDTTQLGSGPIGQKSETSSDAVHSVKIVREGTSAQTENTHCGKSMVSNSVSVHSSRTPGTKRSKSCWRDTRANNHEQQRGIDPHDDFLNTQLEDIIRCNLKKACHDQKQNLLFHAPKDMEVDNSDEETCEEKDPPVSLKQPISITKPVNSRGFKYVGPVRKKVDRERLKGIECKQCKKFYDAVHPDGGDKNGNNDNTIRCEHHDGISRHRYKYVPPMTPEGFWNIGFDSDT